MDYGFRIIWSIMTIFQQFWHFWRHSRSNREKGNRGDVRKIHVTRQFFEASVRHGDLIEKTKNPFLDKVSGSNRSVS